MSECWHLGLAFLPFLFLGRADGIVMGLESECEHEHEYEYEHDLIPMHDSA